MATEATFEWQPDILPEKEFKNISPTQMRVLGLTKQSNKMVDNLEDLRKDPPNIIIATSTVFLDFEQNHFKKQTLQKKTNYVMGLGVYQQLFFDPRRNKKLLKPSKLRFKQLYSPYRGENLDGKTLLVFRTGGIGDLLFIQPNLRYLKEKYPLCTIWFGCGPQYQSMVETWDCVDEVLDLPFTQKRLMDADYHALFEGVIERCKLAESVNSYNLFTEWLGLNLPNELLLPKQNSKPEKVEFCREKLSEWKIKDKDFILMQLRASSPVRTPRPDFWVELINKLTERGYKILLTDNPRQTKYIDKFINFVNDKDKVFNFCEFSTTLDYSIALTDLASCVVATDSALNHIAASLETPCYGIYGPFPGSIRLTTYPKAKWVDAQRNCAPCFIHSPMPCPQAKRDRYSPCYDNIDKDRVVNEIEELIKNG
ncbi:MAG: glycosyltransferase family 9 protein [Candidatus Thorarchaeota archaeon]